MLALGGQNSFVGVDGFVLNEEHNVTESGVVYYFSHVCNKWVHGLVVDFVFFEFADIQNADVVEPLASVESSKNEKLLHANHTCSVSLTTGWCLLILNRVRPAHRVGVKDVKIVAGYNLFEGFASTVISAEKINLVSYQIRSVTSQAFRRGPVDLRLCPCKRLGIKDM